VRAAGPRGPASGVDGAGADRYTSRLTLSRASRYKAALIGATALLAGLPGSALAEKVAGAVLPDGAVKVGDGRYEVPRNYEETLKFFRQVYGPGKFRRRPIADQPTVKAVHIENPDARPGQWEGLNVYELKGVTRVFVLLKKK
jgi:hypothetical protein